MLLTKKLTRTKNSFNIQLNDLHPFQQLERDVSIRWASTWLTNYNVLRHTVYE